MTAGPQEVVVRRFKLGDAALFRDVRLRALEESPDAFGSTHAREQAMSREEWTEIALRNVDPNVLVLAVHEGRAVGVAGGYVIPDRPGSSALWGMWVDPSHRGGDTAQLLVDEVIEWATEKGAAVLELWVVVTNRRAIRFYERCGFSDTGDRQPMPRDSTLSEQRMQRRVPSNAD
jgi:GNAT superfamily N-acetyltransferase